MPEMNSVMGLQTTQSTGGGAAIAVTNCVEAMGARLTVSGQAAMMTRWMVGTAPHKSG